MNIENHHKIKSRNYCEILNYSDFVSLSAQSKLKLLFFLKNVKQI